MISALDNMLFDWSVPTVIAVVGCRYFTKTDGSGREVKRISAAALLAIYYAASTLFSRHGDEETWTDIDWSSNPLYAAMQSGGTYVFFGAFGAGAGALIGLCCDGIVDYIDGSIQLIDCCNYIGILHCANFALRLRNDQIKLELR